MSHKLAKIARRAVRKAGHNPREYTLSSGATYSESKADIGPFSSGLARVLEPTCGRAIYRALKKAKRRGQVSAAT